MKNSLHTLIFVFTALVVPTTLASANSGDFAGGVAIGTGYAGIDTAPANGMLVQGNVGIGTTSPQTPVAIYASGSHSAYQAFSILVPSLVNNGFTAMFIGQGLASNSAASLAYTYNSTTPANSYASLGVFNSGFTLNVTGNSTVGIGTEIPRGGSTLDVNGAIYVGSFGSSSSTVVCQNSNILSSCTSARRFKDNIQPSELGLKEVLAMKPVTFDLKDHDDTWEKHDFGFIAEDMEKINPLFATYDDKGEINGVRYMQLTAVNAKAIQELHGIIMQQQADIDELKEAIKQLKQQK